ncbi:MAG: NUDIX hydrolase [Erysipelotrichaceae bacterium]|nr:NUDIX hydrolase [Erysipelotrichaceae bacterium]
MVIRNEKGQTEKEFLESYDDSKYRHPSNTVDMLLLSVIKKKLSILLIKRRNFPWINTWALPGGFVEFDEDLDDAAFRELKEETNIDSSLYFRQLYTLGKADRDPRTRVITTAYISLVPQESVRNTRAGDDAKEAKWFTIKKVTKSIEDSRKTSSIIMKNEEDDIEIEYEIREEIDRNYIKKSSELLSREEIAGDHIKLINMAMDMLQTRVASSGLLFSLLPEEFTLKEAQEVYETILDKKQDTRNFRRSITKMLKKTGRKKKTYNRESDLYSFDPMYEYLKEDL